MLPTGIWYQSPSHGAASQGDMSVEILVPMILTRAYRKAVLFAWLVSSAPMNHRSTPRSGTTVRVPYVHFLYVPVVVPRFAKVLCAQSSTADPWLAARLQSIRESPFHVCAVPRSKSK